MHEFSPFDESSSTDDGQGSILDRAKEVSIKKILRSKDKSNQRFINMLRMQKAHRYGVRIGFKSFKHSSHYIKKTQEEKEEKEENSSNSREEIHY